MAVAPIMSSITQRTIPRRRDRIPQRSWKVISLRGSIGAGVGVITAGTMAKSLLAGISSPRSYSSNLGTVYKTYRTDRFIHMLGVVRLSTSRAVLLERLSSD